MTLPWWLATTACAPPPPPPQLGYLADLLAFFFLSPCPQRALLGAVDLVFIAASLVLAARRLRRGGGSDSAVAAAVHEREALLQKPPPPPPLFRYAAALGASAVFAAASVVLLALALLLLPTAPWRAAESAFLAVHAVAHGAATWTVASSGRGAGAAPAHLRVFWLATALGAALFSVSAAVRGADGSLLLPDDPLSFAGLLVSLPLAYVAVTGFPGHGGAGAADVEAEHAASEAAPATPYAAASFLSRATFSWINHLISKGYAAGALTADDVPPVSDGHRAETSYALFMSNWPAPGSRHPVGVALWLSFWPQLVLTAALGLARMAAMYVGPSLIDRFVEFVRRGGTPWEGLRLVLILVAGKAVQTLASHHYNFQGQLLGMRIRGALQTALYRKSLRLSTGARRAHGTGAIVNYMQVDAGMVSSAMHGLHGLWLMPLQIVVALLLLYAYLGAAVLMTLAVIAAVTVVTAFANKLNLSYQLRFLGVRDSRIKAITEMLNHMRVIKLQAWEETFADKVRELRLEELGWLRRIMLFVCANNVVFSSGPLAMTVLVFGTYLAAGGVLDAGKVFTATAFFGMLDGPMRNFPHTIVSSMQAFVSLGRLNKFLMDTEIDSAAVERVESTAAGAVAVQVQGGVFAWDVPAGEEKGKDGPPGHGAEQNGRGEEPEMETVLKGIDLEVRRGELAAVVGTVGSGKSSLLSCIMGEMHKVSGKVSICGSTAFVAQTAWIRNETIQENILFGKPMHPDRYSEVIRACCLEKDLEIMEFGDQTEIGERGINLSGGQKQRIQLARAVYQDCDIYLLDDIFSAVDAHTGSTIFMECLKGILKNKTVLLVTHQVDFLQNVDTVFVMKDGLVIQSGIYHELLASCSDFSALVAAHHSSMEMTGQQGCHVQNTGSSLATKSSHENGETTAIAPSKEAGSSKLIQEEEKESGRVSWRVYKLYMTEAWGWWGVLVFLAVSLLSEGSSMASNYWLSYETSGGAVFDTSVFLNVYVLIVAATIVFDMVSTLVVTFSGLQSAQAFFNKMFDSILRAPMSFFDTTPSGRILSRASSDQTKIDIVLVFYVGFATSMCISVVTNIAVTCQVAWPSVIAVIPLLLLNIWYRNRYIATSRELTRLQGLTGAPVIDHFTETFLGAPTVRCFRKEDEFYQTNLARINSNLRMSFHNYSASEWLGFRLELLGTLILSITAFPETETIPSAAAVAVDADSRRGQIDFGMECIAEMPSAPLDRRPRKRQRLGWDVGPAEFHQIQLGFCGKEVANAISAVALGLSSGGIVSSQENKVPRLGSPPLREDDKDGHYVFAVGDNLTPRYKINAKMGEGTFGQVLECWDRERKEMVAIKIIRGIKKYRDAAMIEIGMLEQLGKYDESRSSCVQIRNWFDYRNHICIVFERLGPSLYDFLRKNNYRSFPIALVREVAKQLLGCIAFMHELRLIHTDLKPENILLVSPEYIKVPDYKVSSRSPKEGSYYKRLPKSSDIKVIDFGSTTYDQKDQSYVVSTRHYRAPEVILGLGWSYPCDIWSVGCILVELCTGEALFQTHENLEHLAMMERVLGPLPYHMLKRADRHSEKYIRKGRLNWPEGCTSRESMKAVMKLPRLQNLVMENVDQSAGDFIDLLHGLLKYDPTSRLTAQEALRHPFLAEGSERR